MTISGPVPPLAPRAQLLRSVLVMVLVLSGTLLLQLVWVSGLQHSAAQQRAFDRLRGDLARGTAPVGPTDESGDPLPGGTPVALIEIPAIGVKEVVVEGTSPSNLFTGPGHSRETPLPGQVGTSIVVGRRASYGGPFGGISGLKPGEDITVTTGQGTFEFVVVGVRREGDPVPDAPQAGSSRLTLVTADGTPFIPGGVVRVDADLDGDAVGGAKRIVTASTLPPEERLLAGDSRTLWALALWLQAMIALTLAAVWAWHRWGRVQAWIVFSPPLVLAGLGAAGEIARLLPNLT